VVGRHPSTTATRSNGLDTRVEVRSESFSDAGSTPAASTSSMTSPVSTSVDAGLFACRPLGRGCALGGEAAVVAAMEEQPTLQRAVGVDGRSAASAAGVAVVVAFERELDERRAVVLRVAAVEIGRDRDHAGLAASVVPEPDERWFHEIERIAVPQLGCRDAPGAAELAVGGCGGLFRGRWVPGRSRLCRGRLRGPRRRLQAGADPRCRARLGVLRLHRAAGAGAEADLDPGDMRTPSMMMRSRKGSSTAVTKLGAGSRSPRRE
jgi:hypothetical protein